MDPRDLPTVWDAPDNSRLTPKQWSIRLPIHVAARICALCDLYPRKSKTEIIGDLLATALDQLAEALPEAPRHDRRVQAGGVGLREQFERITRRYIEDLEAARISTERGTGGDE